MRILLYLAFFLSGGAGLIYETIWSRYLGLFVGHTAYAQVIVLAIFLGGLSAGAVLVGERSTEVKRPLLWYAGAEMGVGVYGLVFHDLFLGLQELAYSGIFPALAESPLLIPVKWGLISLLILPPSILLGTTFPFMSAGFLRAFPDAPGRVLSLLYFTNSLGAAVGAVMAGFVLVAEYGLPGTVLAAVVLNLVVALVAWGVEKGTSTTPEAKGAEPGVGGEGGSSAIAADLDRLWRLLLFVSFGTAVASFIYEIAWIRMLSLVLGTATHSFELMLSAFILGLAAGAYWMRSRADRIDDPVRVLGWIQLIMGASALATLPLYVMSFGWTAELLEALSRTPAGYRLFNLFRYGTALAVMLPATFCAGTTLPLITRTLFTAGAGERAIGWVYGVNTLGSIVGVVLAALILMPLVGVKSLLVLGGGLDMALGVVLFGAISVRFRQMVSDSRGGEEEPVVDAGRRLAQTRTVGAAAAASALVIAVLLGIQLDRALLSSGVYRTGRLPSEGVEILYYEDGRTATVAADQKPQGVVTLSTNGKPDATLSNRWLQPVSEIQDTVPLSVDEPTQIVLALVTLAHNPGARSGMMVGQGSGLSSHILLGDPYLESLTTVEIEPAMLEGSRVFHPANRRVFEDPRSRFVLDDAKSFLAQDTEPFDLIVSEPSNPWVSGVASLFSTEFYGRVSQRLAPGGVFGQWLHLYEISDLLVLSVLAAIHETFSDYQVFLVHNVDMVVVATAEGRLAEPDWSVFQYPDLAEELARTHPFHPELLERLRFLNREALAPLLEGGVNSNSDFFPILDLGAERTRFLRTPATGFLDSATDPHDIADAFLPVPLSSGRTLHSPIPQIPRARAIALRNRVRRALASGSESDGAEPMDGEDPELSQALYRLQRAESLLSFAGAPADWAEWTRELLEAAGWAPATGWEVYRPGLLSRMVDLADALEAPRGVLEAIEFVQALAARDWEALTGPAQVLAEELEEGRRWVAPESLLDGGTTAFLKQGKPVEARAFFAQVVPLTNRSVGDLRSRLLVAHLDLALSPR